MYDFVTRVLGRDEVEGKRVLEVGALDVNGSVRPYVTSLKPVEYVGTDRRAGRRVDVVVGANNLESYFGFDRFDVVICTETLEHVQRWKDALDNMFAVCVLGGLILITTRSPGFPRHEHPDDHWRWTLDAWRTPWLGGGLLVDELDPEAPGIFLLIRTDPYVYFTDFDPIHATRAPVLAPH